MSERMIEPDPPDFVQPTTDAAAPRQDTSPLVTVHELAAWLRCDVATIYCWRRAGRLPGDRSIQVGPNRWIIRYDRRAIEDWLAQGGDAPHKETP